MDITQELISAFSWISDINAWVALATLVFLEIVLGIDNIIFIAILVSSLPEERRDKARIYGLLLAMISRIALLFCLFWVMKLQATLFEVFDFKVSGRDVVLFFGGLFLLYKATSEIHAMSKKEVESSKVPQYSAFGLVLLEIMVLDIIFSLDSVITAVGMVDILPLMVIAIVLSVLIMLFASKGIAHFIESNPSIKILALSFLMLVGVTLVADSLHFHIPRGYIYFAIIFSLSVEMVNLYVARKHK